MSREELLAPGNALNLLGPGEVAATHTGHGVASVALGQGNPAGGTRHDGVVERSAVLQAGLLVVKPFGLAVEAMLSLAAQGVDARSVSQISQVKVHSALGIADDLENIDEKVPRFHIRHSLELREMFTSNGLVEIINSLFTNQVSGQILPEKMICVNGIRRRSEIVS